MGLLRRLKDGKEVVLGEANTAGRWRTCQIWIESPFGAAMHAQVRWNGRSWEVVDLGSTAGTFLDGRVVSRHEASPLSVGAEVTFGDERWHLVDDLEPTGSGGFSRLLVAS